MIRRIYFLVAAILAFTAFAAAPVPKPEAARLNNLGVAYMNQQFFEKALKYFEDSSKLDPDFSAAKLNQGIALVNLGRVEPAKIILEDVVKRDPQNPRAWYNLGLLYKNSENPLDTANAFHHVVEIDPNDADTWYFFGAAYSQAKQFPQAIDAFEHALKLNPLHASAQFGLSRSYQQSGDSAHAKEHLVRFQYITQHKLGAPISLAYGEQGKYSLSEESPSGPPKLLAQIPVKFVDVTKEGKIAAQGSDPKGSGENGVTGPGACFLDYDNDGRLDLFLPDNGAAGGVSLYHNMGNGRFEDVTAKSGLRPNEHALACTSGDYDNDGFADLSFTSGTGLTLLHNEHDGTFKDVSAAAGLTQEGHVSGLTFVDYDHDGDLDIFVGGSTELWRNNGNGTFTSVAQDTLYSKEGATLCSGNMVGSDINNDRAVDLVTTCPAGTPDILLNPREGKFQGLPWSSEPPRFTQGVAVLDFNHDGWMDLAFSHTTSPGLTLWRNNQGKSFEPVALPATDFAGAFGIAAFDYDNDGWVDLAAVGETKDGKGEIKLFRNLGPDGFKDVTADVGLDKIQLKNPRALITADYDGDGATDLLITQNHGPAILLAQRGWKQEQLAAALPERPQR